jgi:hypothetical protein
MGRPAPADAFLAANAGSFAALGREHVGFRFCQPRMIVDVEDIASTPIRVADDRHRKRCFRRHAQVFACSIRASASHASSSGLRPGSGTADWMGGFTRGS